MNLADWPEPCFDEQLVEFYSQNRELYSLLRIAYVPSVIGIIEGVSAT